MISVSETLEMQREPQPLPPATIEDKFKRVEDLLEKVNEILQELHAEQGGEYLFFADTYEDDDGAEQFGLTKYKRID